MSEYEPPTPAQPAQAAPGWYPVNGQQRYWDGNAWTEHVSNAPAVAAAAPMSIQDERTWAMMAHLSAIVLGFIGPLAIWLIKRDQNAFVDFHGKQALNFQISMFIAFLVSFILIFILIGVFLMLGLFVANLVLPIMAGVAANRGEHYRYPVVIDFIK